MESRLEAGTRPRIPSLLRDLTVGLLVTGCIVLLQMPMFTIQVGVSPVWLAGGAAIGVLLALPRSRWGLFLVLLGAMSARHYATSGWSPLSVGVRTLVDILIAVAVSWAIKRFDCLPPRRPREAYLFVTIATGGGVVRMLASLFGRPAEVNTPELALYLAGNVYTNTVIGILAITPFAYYSARSPIGDGFREDRRRLLSVMVALVPILGLVTVAGPLSTSPGAEYLLAPVLLAAANLLRAGGLSIVLAITAVDVGLTTAAGRGPFSIAATTLLGREQNILEAQAMLIVLSAAIWVLHAIWQENARVQVDLRREIARAQESAEELSAIQLDLEQSVRLLRRGEELGDMGTYVDDFERRRSRWSDGLYQLLGVDAATVDSNTTRLREFVHPDDLADYDREFAESMARPGVWTMYFRIVRPDGEVLKVSLDTELAFDPETGRAVSEIGMMRNVSDEENYRMLAENASDVIVRISRDNVVEWVSQSITTLLGHQPTSLLGRSALEFLTPETREHLETLDLSTVVRFEGRARTADGGTRWLRFVIRPVKDRRGHTVARVLSLSDADAEVQARSELQLANEKFKIAVQNASIPMSFGPLDGQFDEFNDAMCEFFGLSRKAFADMDWRDYTHPDHLAEDEEKFAALLRGDIDSYRILKRYIHADGSTRWGDFSLSRISDPNGGRDFGLAQIVDVTKEHEAIEELEHQARTDGVTNLYSRSGITELVGTALAARATPDDVIAAMFVDLSDFLVVHSTLGYEAGDELLAQLASRLRAAAPSAVSIGRFDGMTFLMVLPNAANRERIEDGCRTILNAIEGEVVIRDHRITRSAWIGVAFSAPDSTRASLLRDADTALKEAKERGRAQWRVYERADRPEAEERLRLEHDLLAGLNDEQFRLYFQPQFGLRDRQLAGHEVLVRWEHPTRGLLTPAAFIDVAEESGLLVQLGRQIFDLSCRTLAEHPSLPGRLSVNFSPTELASSGWLDHIEACLRRWSVSPERLVIEVTETAVFGLDEEALQGLRTLRDRGMGIHVDDFGTGYSSISLLRDLPVTGLKLDVSFVQDLDNENGTARSLSAGLAGLAAGLGLETIAEGIETAEQATALAAAGWEIGQGYYYGRPEPEFTVAYAATGVRRRGR